MLANVTTDAAVSGLSFRRAVTVDTDGLLVNLIAFNVGVEIGQLTALAVILLVMRRWRATPSFAAQAYRSNVIMMGLGFYLMGVQLVGYAMA